MRLELNTLEAAVLRKLTEGNHRALAVLRQQLADVSVRNRSLTGVGFLTELSVPETSIGASGLPLKAVHFGDVVADIPELGHGAGFVLFLRDGRLSCLEGYTFGEPWPESVTDFSLRYAKPARELGDLEA